MLTPDVRFEGWTTDSWGRFLQIWTPRAPRAQAESTRARGGVIALHEGGRLRKVLHTHKGRLEIAGEGGSPLELVLPAGLGELARTHHASWALAAERGALEEVMERFGARSRRGEDFTDQTLLLINIVRELLLEGRLELWPHRLRGVPVPTAPMVRRTLDGLCADGHTIVLGLFRGGDLWTAFVARRNGDGFDVLAGPEDVRPTMGLLSGDWSRDYRHLARAVEEHYGPLSFGCFADVDAFRELQLDGSAGAWARAVALREVVLSPVPTAVALALGADGARYAFGKMRGVRRRVDPFGLLDPVIGRLRDGVVAVTGSGEVREALGFDPLAVLRALLQR